MPKPVASLNLNESCDTHEETLNVYGLYVAEHTSALLSYWDKYQTCRYANRAFYMWFGDKDPVIKTQLTIKKIIGFADNKYLTRISEVLKGIPQTYQHSFLSPKGNSVSCLVTLAPHFANKLVKGFILQIVQLANDNLPEAQIIDNPLPNADLMDVVATYLQQHILKAFPGLPQLAKNHCISLAKLKRDFKNRYHTSPFAYYRNLQMQFADQQINTQNLYKKELAVMLNFSNLSNFYTCYKKYKNGLLS